MAIPEHSVVNDAFKLLAKNTALTLSEYTSITQSEADIEQYLKRHIETFSTVLHGAFSRKTMVSPLPGNTVDMLVIFRESDVKYTYPSRIFEKLQTALIQQYPGTATDDNKSTLTLPVNSFYFTIRPAYPLSTHAYMLPDEKFNEWVKHDLKIYNDTFTKENVRHKGKLIEVVRMIKTWNRVSGELFNGYYLEIIVTEILSSYEIISYKETLRYIFNAGVARVAFQKLNPANMELHIEGLNDISDLIAAMRLIKKSFHLTDEAIQYEQQGNSEKALQTWNKLFPRAFPSPIDLMVEQTKNTGAKGAEALKSLICQK